MLLGHEVFLKNKIVFSAITSCAILEIVFTMLPIYYGGFLCRKNVTNWKIRGSIAGFIGILIGHYVLNISFDVRTNSYSSTIGAIFCSICGIFVAMGVGGAIKQSILGKVLTIVGQYSMYIMVFHSAIYKILGNLYLRYCPGVSQKIVLAVQLLASILISVGIGKV